MSKNTYSIPLKLFTSIALLCSTLFFAEGSKDLYPSGIQGQRAFLEVRKNIPGFSGFAEHYVYAKEGEKITMASSASYSATVTPEILLTSPNGSAITLSYTSGDGRIANRAAELAGPLRFSEPANGGKYKPIYYTVPIGGTGIYKIEFNIGNVPLGTIPFIATNADADWPLYPKDYYLIAAWDVSVIDSNNINFINGRVYTNVFNFAVSDNKVGSYAKIYALTKDGFQYRVSLNGINGIVFLFFANSSCVKHRSKG